MLGGGEDSNVDACYRTEDTNESQWRELADEPHPYEDAEEDKEEEARAVQTVAVVRVLGLCDRSKDRQVWRNVLLENVTESLKSRSYCLCLVTLWLLKLSARANQYCRGHQIAYIIHVVCTRGLKDGFRTLNCYVI